MPIIQRYASGGRRVHDLQTPPAAATEATADTPQVGSSQVRVLVHTVEGERRLVAGRPAAPARRKADGHG